MTDSFSAGMLIIVLALVIYPCLGFLSLLGINELFSTKVDTSLLNCYIAGWLIAILRVK